MVGIIYTVCVFAEFDGCDFFSDFFVLFLFCSPLCVTGDVSIWWCIIYGFEVGQDNDLFEFCTDYVLVAVSARVKSILSRRYCA